MRKIETIIPGVVLIEPEVYSDQRGAFFESYNRQKFLALGLDQDWPQDNHSISKQGVLRGLHFQYPPRPMPKLVRCTRGKIFDVVVDMRQDSPTFKRWLGVELSAENKRMLFMPEGTAHGFYALEDCEILYKCGALFDKELDGGFAWNDPEIGVEWPPGGEPILSDRDKNQPSFAEIVGRVNAVGAIHELSRL